MVTADTSFLLFVSSFFPFQFVIPVWIVAIMCVLVFGGLGYVVVQILSKDTTRKAAAEKKRASKSNKGKKGRRAD